MRNRKKFKLKGSGKIFCTEEPKEEKKLITKVCYDLEVEQEYIEKDIHGGKIKVDGHIIDFQGSIKTENALTVPLINYKHGTLILQVEDKCELPIFHSVP